MKVAYHKCKALVDPCAGISSDADLHKPWICCSHSANRSLHSFLLLRSGTMQQGGRLQEGLHNCGDYSGSYLQEGCRNLPLWHPQADPAIGEPHSIKCWQKLHVTALKLLSLTVATC